jgi:hypothetical protein
MAPCGADWPFHIPLAQLKAAIDPALRLMPRFTAGLVLLCDGRAGAHEVPVCWQWAYVRLHDSWRRFCSSNCRRICPEHREWLAGCFYVLIAINAFALLCFLLFYWPPSFRDKHAYESKKKYIMEFDYIDVVLLAGGLLVLLMGLQWGGSRYRWDSAYEVASMVVGRAAFFAFIAWECYGAISGGRS